MADYKLILTDLDGTLVLPEQYDVSERVQAAIRQAQTRGVTICVVTGRPYEMCEQVFKALRLEGPCVLDGGATIADVTTGEIVWSQWLEADQVKEVIRLFEPHAASIAVGSTMTVQRPGEIDLVAITEPMSQVWANIPQEIADELEATINKLPGVIAHVNPEPGGAKGRMGIQATHHHADKSYGVEQLLQMLGLPPQAVIAIGDGNNDIPLFRHSGLKIAVGNATDKLKALADQQVAPVYEDGFAEMVERFILPA